MKKLIEGLKASKWRVLLFAALIVLPLIFVERNFIKLIMCSMIVYVIASSGLDLLFGYSGQISMGHAAYYAIGAYTSALLTLNTGIPMLLTTLFGGVLAALMGIVVAFATTNLVKHFLSLATIAFGQIIYLLAIHWEPLTNGSRGLRKIPPPSIGPFVLSDYTQVYYFFLVIAILLIFIKYNLVHSHVGRAMIAIRENTSAANGLGINIRYYKVLAFAVSALFTGLAGGMHAHLIRYINPDTFTRTISNMFFTMVLFGGRGTIVGPIIGAILITFLSESLQDFGNVQQLIYGIILIVAVMFMPLGIVGTFKSLKAKFLRKPEAGKAAANEPT